MQILLPSEKNVRKIREEEGSERQGEEGKKRSWEREKGPKKGIGIEKRGGVGKEKGKGKKKKKEKEKEKDKEKEKEKEKGKEKEKEKKEKGTNDKKRADLYSHYCS